MYSIETCLHPILLYNLKVFFESQNQNSLQFKYLLNLQAGTFYWVSSYSSYFLVALIRQLPLTLKQNWAIFSRSLISMYPSSVKKQHTYINSYYQFPFHCFLQGYIHNRLTLIISSWNLPTSHTKTFFHVHSGYRPLCAAWAVAVQTDWSCLLLETSRPYRIVGPGSKRLPSFITVLQVFG